MGKKIQYHQKQKVLITIDTEEDGRRIYKTGIQS